MELLQLKYFCDAAENENFSKTAQKFNVPPSNISQTVNRLEKELGISLFDRSANRITLNERGRKFYENIKSGLEKIEDAKKIISEKEDELTGEIYLQVITNRRIVTEAIEKFRLEYPKVSFVINHSSILDEKSDLIITDNITDENSLEKKLLVTEDILLALSKNNPLAKERSLKISDLKNERFITMPKESSLYNITKELCRDFFPNIAIMTDDPFYIRKYIELGLGIAFVPAFSWKGQFPENVVLKNISDFKRHTYIYYSKIRYMSNAAKCFLENLIKTISQS